MEWRRRSACGFSRAPSSTLARTAHVICLQPVDRPPVVENVETSGDWHGVTFEYTSGTTVRHSSFAMRRVFEVRGWVNGALRLVRLRRAGPTRRRPPLLLSARRAAASCGVRRPVASARRAGRHGIERAPVDSQGRPQRRRATGVADRGHERRGEHLQIPHGLGTRGGCPSEGPAARRRGAGACRHGGAAAASRVAGGRPGRRLRRVAMVQRHGGVHPARHGARVAAVPRVSSRHHRVRDRVRPRASRWLGG